MLTLGIGNREVRADDKILSRILEEGLGSKGAKRKRRVCEVRGEYKRYSR